MKYLNVHVMDVSNHSGDVLLKWEEPVAPNGLIVTYQIEYRRIDIEHVSGSTVRAGSERVSFCGELVSDSLTF